MGHKVSVGKLTKAGFAALGAMALAGGTVLAYPAAANGDEGKMEAGRQLFSDWSCGSCHVLKDAGGMGHVGPSLDGNTALTKDLVVSRVSNGQGAMPGFAGALTDEEIAVLADYIVAAKAE